MNKCPKCDYPISEFDNICPNCKHSLQDVNKKSFIKNENTNNKWNGDNSNINEISNYGMSSILIQKNITFFIETTSKRPNIIIFTFMIIIDIFALIFGFNNTLINQHVNSNVLLTVNKIRQKARKEGYKDIQNIRIIHVSLFFVSVQAIGIKDDGNNK